jgi:hypothetical protein
MPLPGEGSLSREFHGAGKRTPFRIAATVTAALLVLVLDVLTPVNLAVWLLQIRNESGSWEQLEAYICDSSHAQFTHGVCQECVARMHVDLEMLSSQR